MFVTSGRARLACEVTAAAGSDVLLIHAGVTDRRAWRAVTDRLSASHRCVSYDARGYGETRYGPESGWSDVSDARAVLDAVGIERACLVAASVGGRTAIDLALASPERVSGLALIAPGVRGAPPAPDPTTKDLERRLEAAQAADDREEVNRLEARVWLDGPDATEPRVRGAARTLFLAMNGQALRAADPGPPHEPPPAWTRLDQISVPTSVIIGSRDTGRMRMIASEVAGRVPGARLVPIDGVAHLPHLEGDARCLDAIAALTDAVDEMDA